MLYEVEQKFHVPDPKAVEDALASLGVTVGEGHLESDTYLAHPARDFGATDEAFRLRSDRELNFVTYKGARIDTVTKTRPELNLRLPDGPEFAAQFRELMARLSFGIVADVRKVRRSATLTWEGTSAEVVLDQVEGLGSFAEIEMIADEGAVEETRRKVASLALRLGLTQNERRGYCEMVLARNAGG